MIPRAESIRTRARIDGLGPRLKRALSRDDRTPSCDMNPDRVYCFLTFFGSQTSFFFLTTAPQSSQRYRPGLGFAFDFPFLQLMAKE